MALAAGMAPAGGAPAITGKPTMVQSGHRDPRDHTQGRPLRLFGVFTGRVDDGGFVESGYQGAVQAQREFGFAFDWVQNVTIDTPALIAAAEQGLATGPDLLVIHGGRSNEAVEALAPRYPQVQFLSTHGERAGPNFSASTIGQPQSAYLAGALAGLMTRSNVVGHLSGIRIPPGLRSRVAWAAGVRAVNPMARIVTCFCGTQDDNAISKRAALAEIDAGVDILYTMLNTGRTGAIEACRERGVAQIGNARDWTKVDPEVFIASAIADTGRLVYDWLVRVLADPRAPGRLAELGVEDPQAVRLEMGPRVPPEVRVRIEALRATLVQMRPPWGIEYDGEEFQP